MSQADRLRRAGRLRPFAPSNVPSPQLGALARCSYAAHPTWPTPLCRGPATAGPTKEDPPVPVQGSPVMHPGHLWSKTETGPTLAGDVYLLELIFSPKDKYILKHTLANSSNCLCSVNTVITIQQPDVHVTKPEI